jgi:hypothetical protein
MGNGTIGSPCVAKNALCVGAVENLPTVFAAQGERDWLSAVYRNGSEIALLRDLPIRAASFGLAVHLMPRTLFEPVLVDPSDGCSEHKGPSLSGKLAVLMRGGCLFTLKASPAPNPITGCYLLSPHAPFPPIPSCRPYTAASLP